MGAVPAGVAAKDPCSPTAFFVTQRLAPMRVLRNFPSDAVLRSMRHADDCGRSADSANGGTSPAPEDRWREAEEIAAISDNMFLSPGITNAIRRMRGE